MADMRVVIHQPQYLPWPGYFAQMAQADIFVWLDNVTFSSSQYANRNLMMGPKGPAWLTVPVERDHLLAAQLRDVRIAERQRQSWATDHLNKLSAWYDQSPGWREFSAQLLPLYLKLGAQEMLLDVAIHATLWVGGQLATMPTCLLASTLIESWPQDPNDGILQLLQALRLRFSRNVTYVAGTGALGYLDVPRLEFNGFCVEILCWRPVSRPGAEHCAALDLLLAEGGARAREIFVSNPGTLGGAHAILGTAMGGGKCG
jgi:hypothetical protein